MSSRIPLGFAEVWMQFGTPTDPEPMFCALGLELSAGAVADQTNTDLICAACDSSLDNIVSSDMTLGPGYVLWGDDPGEIRIDSSNTPSAGLAGANAITVNTALLVRKLTASSGRRNRGRMFIPGMPEADFSAAGNMTAGTRATKQTALNNLQTNLVALAFVDGLALLHDSAPFTPTPIGSLEVQLKAATQRRRMRP